MLLPRARLVSHSAQRASDFVGDSGSGDRDGMQKWGSFIAYCPATTPTPPAPARDCTVRRWRQARAPPHPGAPLHFYLRTWTHSASRAAVHPKCANQHGERTSCSESANVFASHFFYTAKTSKQNFLFHTSNTPNSPHCGIPHIPFQRQSSMTKLIHRTYI